MSQYHIGVLAYGYNLGPQEHPDIAETTDYGTLTIEGIKIDPEDDYPSEDLEEVVTRKLYEAIPGVSKAAQDAWDRRPAIEGHYGVEFINHGWCYDGQPSFALVTVRFTVDGGDSTRVDPAVMLAMQNTGDFDEKLAKALKVAGITPDQKRPSWLLMATR